MVVFIGLLMLLGGIICAPEAALGLVMLAAAIWAFGWWAVLAVVGGFALLVLRYSYG